MSGEQVTSKLLFRETEPLKLADADVTVSVDNKGMFPYIVMRDPDPNGPSFLSVDDVRSLRSWLDRVLPDDEHMAPRLLLVPCPRCDGTGKLKPHKIVGRDIEWQVHDCPEKHVLAHEPSDAPSEADEIDDLFDRSGWPPAKLKDPRECEHKFVCGPCGLDLSNAQPFHLSSGGRDPNEKCYSKRDVEVLTAVALAASKLHAERTTQPPSVPDKAEGTDVCRFCYFTLDKCICNAQPSSVNPFGSAKAVFAGKHLDGYLLKVWFDTQEDLDAAFEVVEGPSSTKDSAPYVMRPSEEMAFAKALLRSPRRVPDDDGSKPAPETAAAKPKCQICGESGPCPHEGNL